MVYMEQSVCLLSLSVCLRLVRSSGSFVHTCDVTYALPAWTLIRVEYLRATGETNSVFSRTLVTVSASSKRLRDLIRFVEFRQCSIPFNVSRYVLFQARFIKAQCPKIYGTEWRTSPRKADFCTYVVTFGSKFSTHVSIVFLVQ